MSISTKLSWVALVVTVALTSVSCAGPPPPTLDELHRGGYDALQRGDLSAAEQLADRGSSRAAAESSEEWRLAFGVLKAEVLAGRRQDREAGDLLDPMLQPGPGEGPSSHDANSHDVSAHGAVYVRALMTQGLLRCRSGGAEALEEGLRRLDQAGRKAQALPSSTLQGEIDLRLGSCLILAGRAEEAEPYFEQALAVARQENIPHLESQAAGSLGLVHIRSGKFDEATEWLSHALTIAEQIGADISAAKTISNLGWCYLELGNYERALTLLTRAEASARELGLAGDRITNLNNLGRTLFRLDRSSEAMDRYAQALELADQMDAQQTKAAVLSNMALVAFEQQRLDEAAALLQESLTLRIQLDDGVGRLHTMLSQSQVLMSKGQSEEAERRVRQVLQSPLLRPDLKQEAHGLLALVYAESQRFSEAQAELDVALELLDQTRGRLRNVGHRMSFGSGTKDLADIAVRLAVESGRPTQALQEAIESRARLLRERLGKEATHPQKAPGVSAPGLSATGLSTTGLSTTGRGNTVKHLQRLAAGSNHVFLSYWTSRPRSYLWLVHSEGVELHELPSDLELSRDVELYQKVVLQSGDPLVEGLEVGRRLWNRLVGPIAQWIPKNAQVVIAPDGPLHRLSFDTLIVPPDDPPTRSRYWIEEVTTSLTPSLALLGVAAEPSELPRLLLIGDPVPTEDFPRLAHAGREIQRIAALFEPSRRHIITGPKADPSALRRSNPETFDWIHLAAHVTANPEMPLESAVVLSPGSGSHKLYARDVLDIPLDADLVTLSACRSAGARAMAGEGLVGLAWAFMSTGARHVIGGLWDVEDASTSRLMEQLYRDLQAGDSAAQALRQAKLQLLNSDSAYRKPYYWAPFVLYHGTSSLTEPDSFRQLGPDQNSR